MIFIVLIFFVCLLDGFDVFVILKVNVFFVSFVVDDWCYCWVEFCLLMYGVFFVIEYYLCIFVYDGLFFWGC